MICGAVYGTVWYGMRFTSIRIKRKNVDGRGQRWNSKMDFKKEMLTELLDL